MSREHCRRCQGRVRGAGRVCQWDSTAQCHGQCGLTSQPNLEPVVLWAIGAYVAGAGTGAGDAGVWQERHFKLVTRLSPLCAPKVRFVCATQSPQIYDSKMSMHSAIGVYYHPLKENLSDSIEIDEIGTVWMAAPDHVATILQGL
jgi:hypothetical protein